MDSPATLPDGLPTSQWCPTADSPRCRQPAVFVLFGATGDLTARKLLPAIYSLTADGLLECGLPIVCVGRRAPNREVLVAELRTAADRFARRRPVEEERWREIADRIHYVRGALDEDETYRALGEVLQWAGDQCQPDLGRLFYLATPPEYFADVLTNLKRHGLAGEAAEGANWARLVIEKPYGRDSESAQALSDLIGRLYTEDQVYRMDHYLGKETVQNLVVLRFANRIFEPIWNAEHVHHVEITVAETVGLEGRGSYFDSVGILRDVVENHLLQVLALVAMEPPAAPSPEALRDAKLQVLRSLRPIVGEAVATETVRGRYGPGVVAGESVPGYLAEPHVAPDSRTETFVALRAFIDTERWEGVPFYVRVGKRLARRAAEVVVSFRGVQQAVVRSHLPESETNRLVLRIQPDEGADLSVLAKQPGPGLKIAPVALGFRYAEAFAHEPPEAYERLLLDALLGDHTLFARAQDVQAAWDFATPILRQWETQPEPPAEYPAGSWGPPGADQFISESADCWHEPGS